ncbi:DUF2515 domain-containing protein [Cytobacillus dafuensis]|uniref:DUF2515 domain-containing protein n=1 Tax=Cytobacillus dafuensis TaxID=1742359 RepID=A0A5B8Z9X4_CYTDA|nr:DUF2515 domain-containing protein [Cytobacillus dafuensis]QED48399.1 DUF2515 domain-containing protein [Cytobacillus dafuensis]
MKHFHKKKSLNQLNIDEIELIQQIHDQTIKNNADNISRTDAYFHFYHLHPEVLWSFLASMVSRNAGWNMCDLEGNWFPKIIKEQVRKKLFLTYERANWLIFQDAFPQLLLYQYSTKINRPMFHLLRFFHVSKFMESEWVVFWEERNYKRLLISQIINEQNIIQKPVIKNPVYKKRVFQSPIFFLQDWFHFSSVIFPTCEGKLYGTSVNGFKSLSKRIELGKRLADILFDKKLYPAFYEFALKTVHTGSRYDYEYYFKNRPNRSTPFLRCTYPVINHKRVFFEDWSKYKRLRRKWLKVDVQQKHPIEMTKWYLKKQRQLKKAIYISELIKS